MRIDDNFDIQLVDRASVAALPDVTHNGKVYVVARPGVQFEAKITQQQSVAIETSQEIVVQLHLDGVKMNYRPFVSETSPAVIDGFKETENGRNTVRPFCFAPFSALAPDEGAQEVENPEQIKVGQILVVVHVVETAPGPRTGYLPLEKRQQLTLAETKKFFLQPSLECTAGAVQELIDGGLQPIRLGGAVPGDLVAHGRRVERDEAAVCELATSSGSKWNVVKKPRVVINTL
eukprot:gene13082-3684_t